MCAWSAPEEQVEVLQLYVFLRPLKKLLREERRRVPHLGRADREVVLPRSLRVEARWVPHTAEPVCKLPGGGNPP